MTIYVRRNVKVVIKMDGIVKRMMPRTTFYAGMYFGGGGPYDLRAGATYLL